MDAERAPTFNAQSKNIFTRQCNASRDGQDSGFSPSPQTLSRWERVIAHHPLSFEREDQGEGGPGWQPAVSRIAKPRAPAPQNTVGPARLLRPAEPTHPPNPLQLRRLTATAA
jgi:hypothetical protein